MRRIRLRVSELAHAQHLSIEQLAEKAGISVQTVQRICANRYASVTIHTLGKLAEALDKPTRELLEDE